MLSLPATAFFGQQLLVLSGLIIVGLAGMLLRNQTAASLASAGLMVVIIWGKIASDIYALPAEDSALLLLQFVTVIFLMEASNTAMSFEATWTRLKGKTDDFSTIARSRLITWASTQLFSLVKLTAGVFVLSLSLLLFGGLLNVSFNQLAISGVLVLVAVASILILLTYRREPEERKLSRN